MARLVDCDNNIKYINPTICSLQQKVSLYAKWFHQVLIEIIGHSEWDLVGKKWIHWFSEQGLIKYTHIL
jgi:hypothetical protein